MNKTYFYFQAFLLATILTLASSCNGQGKLAKDVEFEPIKYGAGDVVTRGFLDKSGNMWFTTLKEGVFRYDGKTFTNFTEKNGLCDNSVSSVIEDKEGIIWFGTASGLCRFDGESFVNIPIPVDTATSDWLKKGYPIINPNSVLSMIQDKKGVFWIGSNGAGVYRYDGKTFTSFLKNKGKLMPDGLHHNVITSITEDKTGNIWFSSFSHGGVTKYDGTAFTQYGIEDGLSDDMISTSYIDKSGNLWFGTRSGGMSRFNASPNVSVGRGETFLTIHETVGPCQNHMASLLEDKTGRFWVASFARSGVCWLDGESFTPTGIKNSEKLNDIKFISEDKAGHIWFGGRHGILWQYDGKILTDFTQKGRL
jgi:ligand-binding sensor domain-containing protein